MDILLTIHSFMRWVVLAVLLGGGTYALLKAPTGEPFTDRPFVVGAVLIDLQVTVGVVLYVLAGSWNEGTFLAWVHPAVMVAMLAIVHVSIAGARREAKPQRSHRRVGAAFLFSLLLTALAIPWA